MKKVLLSISVLVVAGLVYFTLDADLVPKTDSTAGIDQNIKSEDVGFSYQESTDKLPKEIIEEFETSSPHSEEDLAVLSVQQKEKYNNLSDDDREEFVELVSAEGTARHASASGAERYFQLLEEDKKLIELDRKADEAIVQLQAQAASTSETKDSL